MRFTAPAAVLALAIVARADDDLDFDLDDVPSACKTICKPVDILVDRCDVDLHHGSDRVEDLLQNQCICTNKSFDFAKVAALCADCMHQTRGRRRDDHDRADKDDLEDIDRILRVCGFPSTKYDAAAATALANGVRVDATAPTRSEQLTTTIDRSHPANNNGGSGSSPATATAAPTKSAASGGSGTQQPATIQTTASPSTGSSGSSGSKTTSSTSSVSTGAAGIVAANVGFVAAAVAGLLL